MRQRRRMEMEAQGGGEQDEEVLVEKEVSRCPFPPWPGADKEV